VADVRLLLVSPSLDERGAERIVVELARHARQQGLAVTVAAPPGSFDADLGDLGVTRRPLAERRRSVPGAAFTSLTLARVLGDDRPSVIHAHNPKMTVVAHAARRFARGRPRLLATFHGGDRGEDRRAARLLGVADHVVCVDDELAVRMSDAGLPDRKLTVIRNGTPPAVPLGPVERRRLCDELGLVGPVVASVGELVASKAVDRFLHAAAHIGGERPDARFLVVGDGTLRDDLERLAASLGLSGRIRFAGRRRDARALIALSSVVVSTSRSEGLSLVALETLAAGVPLVAPDAGGMRGLLSSGAGVLVPDTEPGTVAAAVVGILRSPGRAAAMGAAGRAVAAEHDLDPMLRSYAGLYDELSG
jgi:glycosyltransferase involved in cell wall biosynthesis